MRPTFYTFGIPSRGAGRTREGQKKEPRWVFRGSGGSTWFGSCDRWVKSVRCFHLLHKQGPCQRADADKPLNLLRFLKTVYSEASPNVYQIFTLCKGVNILYTFDASWKSAPGAVSSWIRFSLSQVFIKNSRFQKLILTTLFKPRRLLKMSFRGRLSFRQRNQRPLPTNR